MSLSILSVSSVNVEEYRTAIEGQKGSLNEDDLRSIEKGLTATNVKRDGNKLLAKESIADVIKALENAGDYYDEYTDPDTQRHQLTPTNRNQGKTPQLRQ